MPEYTVLTVIAVVAVVAMELGWLRTGIFATTQYWISMGIVFAFQVVVDGWLTKLSDPIVIYNPDEMLGLRVPWDVPVEDYGFGFAMVTLTLLVWRRLLDRHAPATAALHDGRRPAPASPPRSPKNKEL